MMRARGIQRRLLQWVLAPLLVLFMLGVYSDFRLAYKPAIDAYDQALVDTALALAVSMRRTNGQVEMALSAQADAVLRVDRADHIFFAAFTGDGQRIAGDALLPYAPNSPNAEGEIEYRDLNVEGQDIRLATMRVVIDGETVWIEVAETTRKRVDLFWRAIMMTAGADFLQLLAVLAIVAIGVRVGLAPLDRLRQEIERRSPRDLQPLPLADVPEEAQPLIAALNRQLALLDESITSRDRFLLDAAHQLKTPLAALQTQLELAMQEADPSARQTRYRQMAEGTARASHLVHQLLALARAEPSAALTAPSSRIDLSALAEKIASTHLDAAIAKEIDIGFELTAAPVIGIPWLLQELIANLVDNALIYTQSGGTVTVRTGVRDGQPFLEVEDNGPGIPPELRGKVFDRFFRISGSAGDGCGLGLSIVKEIATRHKGEISLATGKEGVGTIVRVSFPPCAEADMGTSQ
ncbi:MAG: sensor histidine kinase N-terminal domain-containing protein [Zoogloeaceae bacterium]|jgi:two-component system sensor histidine kinase TctE|nr:sensor histidine kinase N-terminal domain-containing protein [Zoogloeaceae bacterium]